VHSLESFKYRNISENRDELNFSFLICNSFISLGIALARNPSTILNKSRRVETSPYMTSEEMFPFSFLFITMLAIDLWYIGHCYVEVHYFQS
jgi:hypothetical protein